MKNRIKRAPRTFARRVGDAITLKSMRRALGQRRAAKAENRKQSEMPPLRPEQSGGTGTVGADGAPNRDNRASGSRTFARRVGDVLTLKRMRQSLGQRRAAKAENRKQSERPPSHLEQNGGAGTVGADGAPNQSNRATGSRTFARRVGDAITLKQMRRALGQRRAAKAENRKQSERPPSHPEQNGGAGTVGADGAPNQSNRAKGSRTFARRVGDAITLKRMRRALGQRRVARAEARAERRAAKAVARAEKRKQFVQSFTKPVIESAKEAIPEIIESAKPKIDAAIDAAIESAKSAIEPAKPTIKSAAKGYLIFKIISLVIAFLVAIGTILLGLGNILQPIVIQPYYEGTPEVRNQGTIQGIKEGGPPQQGDGTAGTEAGVAPAATTEGAEAPSD